MGDEQSRVERVYFLEKSVHSLDPPAHSVVGLQRVSQEHHPLLGDLVVIQVEDAHTVPLQASQAPSLTSGEWRAC